MGISALGTQVELPDGRKGTVVYNSLVGVGIKWGLHDPNPKDFEGTSGNTVRSELPWVGWPWEPDALLRDPADGCIFEIPCVSAECNVRILRLGNNAMKEN